MLVLVWVVWLLAQSLPADSPGYVRAGDRVERQLREYKDKLNGFFETLRAVVDRDAAQLVPMFFDGPPPISRFGYQIVPAFLDDLPSGSNHRFESRSYSWPITESYIGGEEQKLSRLSSIVTAMARSMNGARVSQLEALIREYRELVANQKTIDQYVQYNRLWQRAIATDTPRFDQMTEIYNLLRSDDAETTQMIRRILGEPTVPEFVRVIRPNPRRTVLRLRMYTDIQDQDFLRRAEAAIEKLWRVKDENMEYAVDIDLLRLSSRVLYRGAIAPKDGEHLDLRAHAARFPKDGGILTTGAESTHAFVGRYIALGPAALHATTLAHEFGHVLGFRDGYVRGYRDLGENGFEIMELTSASDFHDIMSSPQAGQVQPEHFKLILDNYNWR